MTNIFADLIQTDEEQDHVPLLKIIANCLSAENPEITELMENKDFLYVFDVIFKNPSSSVWAKWEIVWAVSNYICDLNYWQKFTKSDLFKSILK